MRRACATIVLCVGLAGAFAAPAAAHQIHVADTTPTAETPAAAEAAQPARGRYVSNEILVAYRPGTSATERRTIHRRAGGAVERRLTPEGVELVAVADVEDAVRAYEAMPDVAFAEPNYLYRAEGVTPDDPLFGRLWGLHNLGQTVNGVTGKTDADIDAPEAWATTRGSESATVAVVDTGVDASHPDLAPNIWTNPGEAGDGKETNRLDDDGVADYWGRTFVDDVHGWDFVDWDNDPSDPNGHGTHVAGTIAARGDDGTGVAGIAWESRIMPLRVLDADGYGSNSAITAAFSYAAAMGAKVVNASLAGPNASQAMEAVIEGAPGTLFVVAAGNSAGNNDSSPLYPCNYTAANLICVAATDQSDRRGSFSNYGVRSVDLGAPGVNIVSTQPVQGGTPRFGAYSGTSMASPHVAGAAALVAAHRPAAPVSEIRSRVLCATEPNDSLVGRVATAGRLNAWRALQTPTCLTASTSAGAVRYGTAVVMRGTVHSVGGAPLAGRTVRIQQRPAGTSTFTTVKSVLTGADGAFAASVKPSKRTQYRAAYLGSETLLDGYSTVRTVSVQPRLYWVFSDDSIRLGRRAAFSGRVLPAHPGEYVRLERWNGTSWTLIKQVPVGSTGTFSGTWEPTRRDSFSVRARFPRQDADHLEAIGATRTLTVS